MRSITLCLISILFASPFSSAQNLPSLLLDKNINATFSILAYDKSHQEWGIAVATNNLYVGNSTVYIQPGIGAFSIIAETDPQYAYEGFEHLKAGKSIREAIMLTREKDKEWYYRQVSGVDASGNVFAFTGAALPYWKGVSLHLAGDQFVVMGNQLAPGVLEAMAETYKTSQGTLAERLLKSLTAGQTAGGQVQGKQSAALVVKGTNNEWFNNIDLRVDHSAEPFKDLQKLLDYHYGRIRLNQASYAIRNQRTDRGKTLLSEAEIMLEGWNGMYSKIAVTHLLLGEEDEAIAYIRKGLSENPAWKENLSAFYVLKDHPDTKGLIDERTFSEKDWANALSVMLQIGQVEKARALSDKLVHQYPASSLLHYVSAKCYRQSGDRKTAENKIKKALELDENNEEAKLFLKEL